MRYKYANDIFEAITLFHTSGAFGPESMLYIPVIINRKAI